MKKIYLFILPILILSLFSSYAQTTETFETETNDATSFSDNNQSFTITTQTPNQTFNISDYAITGWNGTAKDNKYIDNSGTAFYETVQFSIATTDKSIFKLKSMYLFLSQTDLSSGTGNCTIVGKLKGNTVFTAVSANNFNSSAANVNNGFTLINLTTYGGVDNTEKVIDEFVITTSGTFEYVALDALKWQNVQTITTLSNLSTFTTCAGTASASQGFEVGGKFLTKDILVTAPTGYEVSTTSGSGYGSSLTLKQTSGSVATTSIYTRLTGNATGTPSGTITCTTEGAETKNIQVSGTVNVLPTAFQISGNGSYCAGQNGVEISLSGSQSGVAYQLKKSTTLISSSINGTNNALSFGNIVGAGTYTIEAKNTTTNCVVQMTGYSVITENALPTFSSSQVNNVCKGDSSGKAIVTPLTGKAPFTYAWSPKGGTDSIASKLKVGGLYCTLTDNNGCKAIAQFGITEPANFLIGDTTAKACDKFVWKGSTYTQSGNFSKTIKSKLGCDSIVTLHLTINPSDTVRKNLEGCNEVIYKNITYTSNTILTFKALNKFGCDSITKVEIVVRQFKPNTTVSIIGNTLISNQHSLGVVYQWKNCTSNQFISNPIVGDSSFKLTQTGKYKVYIAENPKGACVDSSTCVDFIVTAIENSNSTIGVSVFPNPSNGLFTLVSTGLINSNYKIINTLGVEIRNDVINSDNTLIDISAQSNGVYLLQLSVDNEIHTFKIIKN